MALETTLSNLYKFDKDSGTIDAADYAAVKNIVKSDTCAALGVENSETVEDSTPFGRLIEWLALHFTGVLGLNVQNANQLLVSAAAGQQLDAMAQWFQLERKPLSYSIVPVTCSGDEGTVIAAGSTVRNENGDVFESLAEGKIGSSGSVVIDFEAIEPGAIGVAANTVNIIDSPQTGWESCNNEISGMLGSAIETDESLRDRILSARAVAPGFLEAIKNAVEAVIGNGAAMALENNTNAHLDVLGIDMEPHSILVCVDGLVSPEVDGYASNEKVQAVAKAIFDTKPCGTGYTKAATIGAFGDDKTERNKHQYIVPVTDAFNNVYNVYFCSPISLSVTVSIQVQKRSYTGSNLLGDVKTAISKWANETNFKCGESVYASDIIREVENRVNGVVVVDCTVSDGGTDKGTSFLEIDAIHKAAIDVDNINATQYSR